MGDTTKVLVERVGRREVRVTTIHDATEESKRRWARIVDGLVETVTVATRETSLDRVARGEVRVEVPDGAPVSAGWLYDGARFLPPTHEPDLTPFIEAVEAAEVAAGPSPPPSLLLRLERAREALAEAERDPYLAYQGGVPCGPPLSAS